MRKGVLPHALLCKARKKRFLATVARRKRKIMGTSSRERPFLRRPIIMPHPFPVGTIASIVKRLASAYPPAARFPSPPIFALNLSICIVVVRKCASIHTHVLYIVGSKCQCASHELKCTGNGPRYSDEMRIHIRPRTNKAPFICIPGKFFVA